MAKGWLGKAGAWAVVLLSGYVAWICFGGGVPTTSAVAIPTAPSVLAMPNARGAYDNNSLQDVTLTHSGGKWALLDDEGPHSFQDAKARSLEISKMKIHSMKQVTAGVYVTDAALVKGLTLKIAATDTCRYDELVNNGELKAHIPLAEVRFVQLDENGRTTGTPTIVKKFWANDRSAATDLCETFNGSNKGYTVNLYNHRNLFKLDPDTGMRKIVIQFGYVEDAYNNYDVLGLARFQLRLANVCKNDTVANCRAYVAPIRADTSNTNYKSAVNRNLSLSKSLTTKVPYEQKKDSSPQHYLREFFEFGLACSETQAQTQSVNVYDLNDGDWVNSEYNLTGITLQQWDKATETWIDAPDYSSRNISPTGAVTKNTPILLNGEVTSINQRNSLMYEFKNWSSNKTSHIVIQPREDKSITQLIYKMQPGVRYRLAILPDSAANFMAVGLPGDTIFGIIGCNSYALTPKVDSPGYVQPGSPAVFTNNVISAPQPIIGGEPFNMQWQSYAYVVPKGQPMPALGGTVDDPSKCWPGFGLVACTKIGEGTRKITLTTTEVTMGLGVTSFTGTGGLQPGDKVCSYLAIRPASVGAIGWRVATTCSTVAAAPYLAAVGGTVWAGGSVVAPYTRVSGFHGTATTAYGSFGDYGVFAVGPVDFFGSASLLGQSETMSGMVNGPLTFANTSRLGRFVTTHRVVDQSAQYASASHSAGVLNAAGGVVASGVYKASGNVTLDASVLSPGTHAVVYAPNYTITIRGDIAYNTTGVSSFSGVPSLVLVAKDIVIDKNVSRIDANIFLTLGALVACAQGPAVAGVASGAISLTGECSKPLVINGAVAAGGTATKLVFNRSFGGNAAATPAEMIRMRPEVFLTPYERVQQNSTTLTTVDETELPVRW